MTVRSVVMTPASEKQSYALTLTLTMETVSLISDHSPSVSDVQAVSRAAIDIAVRVLIEL